MPASLPPDASLTQLKNRAKTILKAHRRGDASVCDILRGLERFADEAEWQILDADVSLADVQHALARHYGFRNWRELKTHAEGAVVTVDTAGPALCAASPDRDGADTGVLDTDFGFRYDPMKWATSDTSPEVAVVRLRVLQRPQPGDAELIESTIMPLLSAQLADGLWPRQHNDIVNDTTEATTLETVKVLLAKGCSSDRPEIKRAVDAACRVQLHDNGTLRGDAAHLAWLTGWQEGDEPARSFSRIIAKQKAEIKQGAEEGCPWSIPDVNAMWAARHLGSRDDVDEVLEAQLAWIPEQMNAAGFLSFKDPWAYLKRAADKAHPLTGAIVLKQLPMLLRSQLPDGGWGNKSLPAFRALVTHGLFEQLRRLPPLPPDWRVTRSIPAPDGDPCAMTWDGERFWLCLQWQPEAVALNPDDGAVVKRVQLPVRPQHPPLPRGLAWYSGTLAVTTLNDPRRLLFVDPDTGGVVREIPLRVNEWAEEPTGVTAVGNKLWVADSWNWCAAVVDPAKPDDHRYLVLACPCGGHGTNLAAADDGVWHFDRQMHALVKSDASVEPGQWGDSSDLSGVPLLDWGEKPFGNHTAGIAWDGDALWALDKGSRRICRLEKGAP